MPFINEMVATPTTGKLWRLVESLRYQSEGGKIIEIPEGFECDLASIPGPARWLFPVNGDWTEAAVLHDWLYSEEIGTRADADRLFLEAMESLGVSWWRRCAMYAAVRAGGWLYW